MIKRVSVYEKHYGEYIQPIQRGNESDRIFGRQNMTLTVTFQNGEENTRRD